MAGGGGGGPKNVSSFSAKFYAAASCELRGLAVGGVGAETRRDLPPTDGSGLCFVLEKGVSRSRFLRLSDLVAINRVFLEIPR